VLLTDSITHKRQQKDITHSDTQQNCTFSFALTTTSSHQPQSEITDSFQRDSFLSLLPYTASEAWWLCAI